MKFRPALLLLLLPTAAYPQETSLGLKVAAVPEALARHLPELEPGQGLLVTDVAARSRAAEIGLKKHDVIVSVGPQAVADAAALDARLRGLRAGEREVLEVFRGGKKLALSWPNVAQYSAADNAYTPPRSLIKPGGPPAVSVQARPLADDRFDVTVLYYGKDSGKLERHAALGTLDDVDRQITALARDGKIPDDLHDLINVALRRLRTRQNPPPATGPARQDELDRADKKN